ncbi:unnamed protein product [Arctia plantaginis]|uniref:Uncharacterized protein n=1 Tax=Arctia plantaginis TaxID=874455 RepID=A0A8S0Z1X7_ARCPL|nr:unnamed protein product [Arctia plantaginis]
MFKLSCVYMAPLIYNALPETTVNLPYHKFCVELKKWQWKNVYLDAGENIQYGDQYLDEITEGTMFSQNNTKINVPEKKNVSNIAERFLLEKFSNKTSNANQWIIEFESECERFEIVQNEEKIEILKHLLEKQCLDWYGSMLIKLTVNSEWSLWKANFCETYGNKGWSQIKYAFKFRFQSGSLLEYATKKEKLLLEVNKHIDTQTMINLIVMGLPNYIIEKIDKGSVRTTANLYNEIGKHEYAVNKKNFYTPKQYASDSKGNIDKNKPCKTCEILNKGIRFHPEEKCWFKLTDENYQKKNYNKTVNNSVIDVELNNNNSKN